MAKNKDEQREDPLANTLTGAPNQSTGTSDTRDQKLRAMAQGVYDNGHIPKPDGMEELSEELKARAKAAEQYEKLQNEIVKTREQAAEEEKKSDPADVEKKRLEKRIEAAKEYEEYSNSFVVAQNESREDPVVRDYEIKEAELSDREPPIEHRLETEGIQKVAKDTDQTFTTKSSELFANDRALKQAKEDLSLVKSAEDADKK